jgi:hypothetical protein
MAQIQKIRQLVVIFKTFAGGGNNNDLPLRVCQQNIPDLALLAGISHGAAAEFYNFHIGSLSCSCHARRRENPPALRKYINESPP